MMQLQSIMQWLILVKRFVERRQVAYDERAGNYPNGVERDD